MERWKTVDSFNRRKLFNFIGIGCTNEHHIIAFIDPETLHRNHMVLWGAEYALDLVSTKSRTSMFFARNNMAIRKYHLFPNKFVVLCFRNFQFSPTYPAASRNTISTNASQKNVCKGCMKVEHFRCIFVIHSELFGSWFIVGLRLW